jgi:hypothetical protein
MLNEEINLITDTALFKMNREGIICEDLIKILRDVTLTIKLIKKGKYFESDEEERNIYLIEIKRINEEFNDIDCISFEFGDSLNNTEFNLKPSLYDILCCIKTDFNCPDDFNNFCSEYGYNDDSIRDKGIFEKCKKQSEKLHLIFEEDEIQLFPD